jgi:RNA polymerase sigma-54 factor
MATVADAVGVHETTVSRAIAGKYMSTPQGLREMRYFFTSGLATDDGRRVWLTRAGLVVSDGLWADVLG